MMNEEIRRVARAEAIALLSGTAESRCAAHFPRNLRSWCQRLHGQGDIRMG